MSAVAPERSGFLPRAGASGSHYSHGPTRESYTRDWKARARRETAGPPTTNTTVSAERMRTALSPAAAPRMLLQRWMPASRAKVVLVEGTAKLSGIVSGERETQWTEPTIPRAGSQPPASHAGGGEGNHSRFFSAVVVIVPAVTRASRNSGDHPLSGSVRTHADGRWSGCGSASGAGAAPSGSNGTGKRQRLSQ